ncbi:hypothetical protein CARUB_v10006352mg [Capsella rubella]|uniref:Uncharacterized protein n=1 Tax=Capsella rubella TaxID=81985 RepID=R0F7S6_9BRAS|nr:hypothetical protein CARUB_v10006352mg [Capsella rubella]
MKSIVFVLLLLLLAVATSGKMTNGWGNLTIVHEDGGADEFWDSLAAGKQYLTPKTFPRRQTCNSPKYDLCLVARKTYNNKPCTMYNRCKRGN